MSTPEQRKGDSFRRQSVASARYASAHGLELIEGEDAYSDIGVSAFKGKNVKVGALGRFLDAARAGKISSGAYLIVESLDRVSRQTPFDAATTMRDIVKLGINVVDLSDGERLYNVETLQADANVYMRMILRFERAHDESKTKSARVKEAWSAKRALARSSNTKMTVWCPAWLRLSPDRSNYEIINQHAETVRWIFNEAAEGKGIYSISRRLNEQAVPAFGKSRGWHQSYIIKILRNKSAIGVYEPARVLGRKATPDDIEEHSIKGYFPSIVSDELFHRVQLALTERRIGGGRKGTNFTNLFTGIKISCAFCNGPVKFENKGQGPKGGLYFICDDARRGYNCDAQRWPYQHFEDSFLSFVYGELDFSTLRGDGESQRLVALAHGIEATQGKLAELMEKRRRRVDLIDKVGEEAVVALINEVSAEIQLLEFELSRQRKDRDDLIVRASAIENSPDELKTLISRLDASQSDLFDVRSRLAKLIQSLVSEIIVAPTRKATDAIDANSANVTLGPFNWARDDGEIWEAGLILGRLMNKSDLREYYVARFRNDQFRIDMPPKNPLDVPLATEATTAQIFIYEDGSFQIEELSEPNNSSDAEGEVPDERLVISTGFITCSLRTGSIHFAS